MSIDALAADLRGILIEQMAAIHAADVAVLLSGGADSAAVCEVFDRVRVPPHRILQGKDSRIRELFAQLLDTPYNVKGRKAPAALYRDLIMDE